MVSLLPRFIVMESVDTVGYLSYIHEGGKADGFLRFMEPEVSGPYAKFEIESSKKEDLFHIRSCQSNKYWERTRLSPVPWEHLIAATNKNKEEDKSKDSCTLFQFISVDPAQKTYRIKHVQTGCYVRSAGSEPQFPKFDHGLLCESQEFASGNADVFTVIDWSSLMILPRHVAFKGPNNKYLCLYNGSMPYFGTDDIGEPTAAFEILPTKDGKISIKSSKTGKFLRNDWWIWADVTSTDNADTFFRPLKLNDQKIALISLSNNKFCKRLTADGYVNGLAAIVTSATEETRIKVEEPVLTREIYDIKYDLDNSRVYDEVVDVVSRNSATNTAEEPSAMEVKLEYEDSKSSSWKTDLSIMLGIKTTMNFNVPFIFEGAVELSAEYQSGVEWGKDFGTTTKLEVVNKVMVPGRSEVTVYIVATKGKCDVPFTYKQRDILYDGSSVLREVKGGTYVGSNFYGHKFEIKVKKLPPVTKE
ncbi:hypothetical protein HRI_004655300 [Hibiscus trionum]|uniref:Agglutinin domain-containing protein n=1 Tax=Hibiscus trionum TaxID=183268 RepID=A0A9W7J721_HIBTR|nr:hypothetical protein HRI_004655300 [Hibiscus trionum]